MLQILEKIHFNAVFAGTVYAEAQHGTRSLITCDGNHQQAVCNLISDSSTMPHVYINRTF